MLKNILVSQSVIDMLSAHSERDLVTPFIGEFVITHTLMSYVGLQFIIQYSETEYWFNFVRRVALNFTFL